MLVQRHFCSRCLVMPHALFLFLLELLLIVLVIAAIIINDTDGGELEIVRHGWLHWDGLRQSHMMWLTYALQVAGTTP